GGSATAGLPIAFTVTAQDRFNNTAAAYTGAIIFTSSDSTAVLPVNSTLSNGLGTFSATLKTPGNQTLTSTDAASAGIMGTAGVMVNPGTAARFAVSASAATTAGSAFVFQVTALDQYGNLATGYASTVHVGSSDALAVMSSPNPTLTGGSGFFAAILR